jgi:hypothetical protein
MIAPKLVMEVARFINDEEEWQQKGSKIETV